jgi:ribosomal protein S18 acetylase RimI-like enzyme
VFVLYYPEIKRNFDEVDDFAYDIIYQKELGQKTPKKLMTLWRGGYNILTVRQNESGLLVAMGMLEKPKRNKDSLQLEHIAVNPDYREYGLGSLVVGTLVDFATELGAKRVTLKSVENAIGFYAKCGFTEYDKSQHCMERDIT